jgi:hypothetical protein
MPEDRIANLELSTARIEVQTIGIDTRLHELICAQQATHKMLVRALHGNGEPGIKVRIDRIEQWKGRVTKLNWLIVGSVVPLLTAACVAVFAPGAA